MTTASATALRPDPAGLEPRFAAVYAEHVDYVWTNLRRLGVPAADLDDATQETFLVAFRRWDDFRVDASWRAWLFGITRRVASRYRRGTSRRLRLLRRAEPTPSPPPLPDDELSRRQATALVQRFLEALGPRKREVFILAEIEGLTGAEIAKTLSIKPNTVWSRLRGAREAFDRYLGTLRAREQGAVLRLDRVALMERCRRARAPETSRHRVLSALVVQLAAPARAPWWVALKPVALSVGLGAAGLVGVAGVARVTAPDQPADEQPRASRSASVEPSTRTASTATPGVSAAPNPSLVASVPSAIAPAAVTSATTTASHPVGPPVDSASPTSTPSVSTSSASPSSTSPSATSPSATSPSSTSPSSASASPTSPSAASATPTSPSSASTTPASPSSASPSPASVPPATSSSASALDPRFAEETALLQQIRRATRAGDHRKALRLAEDHAQRFAGGVLGPERQALQIAALCHLGRRTEASAQATAWSQAHPGEPLPREVRRGCIDGEEK